LALASRPFFGLGLGLETLALALIVLGLAKDGLGLGFGLRFLNLNMKVQSYVYQCISFCIDAYGIVASVTNASFDAPASGISMLMCTCNLVNLLCLSVPVCWLKWQMLDINGPAPSILKKCWI
jgi:hypothetical protein